MSIYSTTVHSQKPFLWHLRTFLKGIFTLKPILLVETILLETTFPKLLEAKFLRDLKLIESFNFLIIDNKFQFLTCRLVCDTFDFVMSRQSHGNTLFVRCKYEQTVRILFIFQKQAYIFIGMLSVVARKIFFLNFFID